MSSQKKMSGLVDAAILNNLQDSQQHDAFFLAHLALIGLPGAGVWLTAPPVADDREIDTPLFQVALRRRLRMPVFDGDAFCPSCGLVLDRWGDHALCCQCGGHRTVRHNALRNICCEEAAFGGLRPEREKAGLLPERPVRDNIPGVTLRSGRRPADMWLPRGGTGCSEAWDFAVTSALRTDLFREAIAAPDATFQRYERFKREYKDTANACMAAGFSFVPMVLESHSGAWSPKARAMLDWLAREQAATIHQSPEAVSLRMVQRLSWTLQRENVRAPF